MRIWINDVLILDQWREQSERTFVVDRNLPAGHHFVRVEYFEATGSARIRVNWERLGNTAAAGAIVALKENHADMKPGDHGLLCAFGAGYSIGGALLRMM